MSSDPNTTTAADDMAGMSPAERRAEARRRRMQQKPEDRLARIKALSTGQELPPLSTVVGAAESATDTVVAPGDKQDKATTDDVVAANTAPSAARKPTTTTSATAPSSASDAAPRQRKAGAATAARAAKPAAAAPSTMARSAAAPSPAHLPAAAASGLINPMLGSTPQERMMLAQLQERAYVTATRRWRLIHTLVSLTLGVLLFLWVLWTTAELHVDGEEVLGGLLVAPPGEEGSGSLRIPVVGVFRVFLAVECVLVAARYALDKAATNPPAADVVQQLSLAAPGLAAGVAGAGAGGKVMGLAQSMQNMSFVMSVLVTDMCYVLVVFGLGVVYCAYKTGLDEVRAMFEFV